MHHKISGKSPEIFIISMTVVSFFQTDQFGILCDPYTQKTKGAFVGARGATQTLGSVSLQPELLLLI